ncbi:MAG: hypothetical protein KF729_07050 [Sandaracinaceae bacterium]|nr:hypothetical protein [Sandaracinaceae bacterium]
MADDLGGRLVSAGLVTQRQLAEVLGAAPPHDGALVRALVEHGLPEDGLAGYFVALGYGPLMEPADLAAADVEAARCISSAMAHELLALPIRTTPAGLVVAMAAPTDGHAVGELARATSEAILPVVARVEDLVEALERAHPDRPSLPPMTPRESEPPVIELVNVRRREPAPPPEGYFGSTRGAERVEARVTVGPRLVSDEEGFVPLVRTKPVRPTETPAYGAPVDAPPEAAAPAPAPRRAAAEPAIEPAALDEDRRLITADFVKLPKDTRVVPVGKASGPAPASASGGWSSGRALRPPTHAAKDARAHPRGLDTADTEVQPAPTRAPAQPAPPPRPPRSIIPEEHARWDVDAPAAGPNRVDPGRVREARDSRPPPKSVRPPDVGGALSAIRACRDRDEVVTLACEGALSVSRAAILLALRKGVLKGSGGAGAGLSGDAVRNLWIPTSSPSMFREVVARKEPYHGPPGTAAADGLFRAALGSRGGPVSLHPVVVAGKLVAVLAADDVRFGDSGRERVETLARAVSEAFERIILEGKRG